MKHTRIQTFFQRAPASESSGAATITNLKNKQGDKTIMAKPSIATAVAKDLSERIDDLKSELANYDRQAGESRARIRALEQRPLVIEEPMAMARAEVQRRQAEAFKTFAAGFQVSELGPGNRFFDLGGTPEYRLHVLESLLFASGVASTLLDKVAAAGSAPGAITSAEKAAELKRERATLDEIETIRENARIALQSVGLSIIPDERMNPSVFLEYSGTDRNFNRAKLRWLENELENRDRIGRDLFAKGRDIQTEVVKANDRLALIKQEHNHTSEDIERAQGDIDRHQREQEEQNAKIQTNQGERAALGKLLNACQDFLREQRVAA